MKWFFGAMLLLLGACATTKDYGAGPCKEYRPWCLGGDIICEHDRRGCEICTCVLDPGGVHTPNLMPGQEVPPPNPRPR